MTHFDTSAQFAASATRNDEYVFVLRISENFEPGFETYQDFIRKAAAELIRLAEELDKFEEDNTGEKTQATLNTFESELFVVVGEY